MIRTLAIQKYAARWPALVAGRRNDAASQRPPIDWAARRAPTADTDRVLVSQTHIWLREIPRSFHPRQLCRHYPRVANQLARHWHDPVQTDRLLIDLMIDRRGGRAGFPARVLDELQALQELLQLRHTCAEGRVGGRGKRLLRRRIVSPALAAV